MRTRDMPLNIQKDSLGVRSGHLLMTLSKYLSRGFIDFLASPRSERALRVTLFLIPLLLLFYNKWFDLNFSHAGPLLYLIMSSLIPPLMASVSLVLFLINAAQFLSMGWVTLMYVIAVSSSTVAGKTAVFLVFLVHVILLSPCKIGKMSPLMNTVSTLGVYICVLGFFNSYPILFGDLSVHVFWPYLHNIALASPKLVQLVLGQLPSEIQPLFSKLLNSEPNSIEFFPPIPLTLSVPSHVTALNDQLSYFVGEKVNLVVHHKGVDAKLVPGLWFVRLAWRATSKLGIIRHLYILSVFSMGCFVVSLLMPPQRYIRSHMRRLLGKCFRTCSKAARNCLYSYIAKNQPELNVTPSYSLATLDRFPVSYRSSLDSISFS